MKDFKRFVNLYLPELNQSQRMKLEREVEKLIVAARIEELVEVGMNVDDWDNYCIKRYNELKGE